MGESGGTIAFTTTTNGTTQWLYLIDTKGRALALYRIDPTNPGGKGILALAAVRNYSYDLKMTEYNNLPPVVDQVKSIVQTLSPTAATR